MPLEKLIDEIEAEIKDIYFQHQQTRKKTLKGLREKQGITNLQRELYATVADGVQYLIDDAKLQKSRAARFKTIPSYFPAPEPSSTYDCLIYSRMIMGYTMMNSGKHGSRLKSTMRKLKSQEKYIELLQKFADVDLLGSKNFHHLCKVGCPQATHEWMYVYDLPSALIANKAVISESKRLLKQYGY